MAIWPPLAEPLRGDLCRLLLQRRGVGCRLHDENLRKGEGLVPGATGRHGPETTETMVKMGQNNRFLEKETTSENPWTFGFKNHQTCLISPKKSEWRNWEDRQDSLDKSRRKWWHLQRCMHDWANKRTVEVRKINIRMARFAYPEIKSY